MKESKDHMNSNNIIGMETHFTGDIETFGNIRIEGRVTGNIKTKSKIVLGQFAYVEGNIYAQNAEISGRLKGKIHVYDTLILKPSSVVEGQIKTNINATEETTNQRPKQLKAFINIKLQANRWQCIKK